MSDVDAPLVRRAGQPCACCQSAWNIDPVSARNIDPQQRVLFAAKRGAAERSEAAESLAAGSDLDADCNLGRRRFTAVAANSIATVRLRGLKIASPEYEAGFRAYMRSKYTTPATGMLDCMGRAHHSRKEFNEIHRDILEPADPEPGFAHGDFKW